MILIIEKDILKALVDRDIDGLVQQCNCLTKTSLGLSKQIEDRFPWVNIYKTRKKHSIPGTVTKFSRDSRDIFCLFGQWRPGKYKSIYWDKYPETENQSKPETPVQRLVWFEQGLKEIMESIKIIKNQKSPYKLGLPFQIGCGLAGGFWPNYLEIIEKLQKEYQVYCTVTLYKI